MLTKRGDFIWNLHSQRDLNDWEIEAIELVTTLLGVDALGGSIGPRFVLFLMVLYSPMLLVIIGCWWKEIHHHNMVHGGFDMIFVSFVSFS